MTKKLNPVLLLFVQLALTTLVFCMMFETRAEAAAIITIKEGDPELGASFAAAGITGFDNPKVIWLCESGTPACTFANHPTAFSDAVTLFANGNFSIDSDQVEGAGIPGTPKASDVFFVEDGTHKTDPESVNGGKMQVTIDVFSDADPTSAGAVSDSVQILNAQGVPLDLEPSVPEPSTWVLMVGAILALCIYALRESPQRE